MKTDKTKTELNYSDLMEEHLREIDVSCGHLVNNFAIYARRQVVARFLARHELFKQIIGIKGSIIECGVFEGQGLMSWAQLSATYEPVAYERRIYGFDTFKGFPSVSENDGTLRVGDLASNSHADLKRSIELFDMNRPLAQFPKVELIKGDFMETEKKFLDEHPYLLVALLYLDFDLYEPTKEALELFLPRIPKGGIIAFDELNQSETPGETKAMFDVLWGDRPKIEKFYFEPQLSYMVL